MSELEDFKVKLKVGCQVWDRGDGSWVAGYPDCRHSLVLDDLEARLAKLFTGQTLKDIAYQAYLFHGHIPFQKLKSICLRMAKAGLLEDDQIARELLSAGQCRRPRWLDKLQDIILVRFGSGRNPEPKSVKSVSLWPAAIMAICGIIILAFLGLPRIWQLMLPGGSSTLGLATIYLAASLALSLRSLLIASTLRTARMPTSGFALRLTAGLLNFDPGARCLVRAPRNIRLMAHGQALAGLILMAAILRLVTIVLLKGYGAAAAMNLIVAVMLGAAFMDLCPVGRTGAHELFISLIPGGQPLSSSLTYLTRRYLRGLASPKGFSGEPAMAMYSVWLLAWLFTALYLAERLAEGNLLPLSRQLFSRPSPALAVISWFFIIALGLSLFSAAIGLLAIMAGAVASLFPRFRTARRKAQKAAEPDQVAEVLKGIPIFSGQTGEVVREIAERAKRTWHARGAVLIRQGDIGEEFFVLTKGRAEVLVEDVTGAVARVARLGPGDCFGEVALIESVPRTATVRALEPCEAIVIDRASFQAAAEGQSGADLVSLIRGANVLKSSPLFAELEPEAMASLLRRVRRIPMKRDQPVIRRGEVGEFFYVTLEGELEVLGPDDKTPVATLRQGDPFGEIALLANVPRTATVVARTDGSLLCLSKDDFNQFFSQHLSLGEKLERLGSGRLAQLGAPPHA